MARKAFGGMTVSFAKCDCAGSDIFGSGAIAPSEMTKRLWKHVKNAHGGHMMRK
ncbi:MAG: hypothetical protein HYT16_01750 [DPANN group archaeon]|nr:hypothetical protein [DPANN group archaeon]